MSETAAAMLTCIQYPWLCKQTSDTTGLILQGFLLSLSCYTEMCVCVCVCVFVKEAVLVLLATNPLLSSLGPRCLLPLWAPGSWLDSFVAESNLRDSLGIASGHRKQGHSKRQATTLLYTWDTVDWAVKATQTSLKNMWFVLNEAVLGKHTVHRAYQITARACSWKHHRLTNT